MKNNNPILEKNKEKKFKTNLGLFAAGQVLVLGSTICSNAQYLHIEKPIGFTLKRNLVQHLICLIEDLTYLGQLICPST
jgi:hypothetical protein